MLGFGGFFPHFIKLMGPNHVLSFSYLSSELRGLLPVYTPQALACDKDLVCNSVLTQFCCSIHMTFWQLYSSCSAEQNPVVPISVGFSVFIVKGIQFKELNGNHVSSPLHLGRSQCSHIAHDSLGEVRCQYILWGEWGGSETPQLQWLQNS